MAPISAGMEEEDDTWQYAEDDGWTNEIPEELIKYGEYSDAVNQALSNERPQPTPPGLIPAQPQNGKVGMCQVVPVHELGRINPPRLPAQLEKGVLNSSLTIAQGSGDDNSILPKPDHSVISHLAASPIKGGLLSVGVTMRYKKKVSAQLLLSHFQTF